MYDVVEKSTIPIDPTFEYQFRLILIGDSTVGKSSLLKYFTDGSFGEVSDPTVGIDFFAKLLPVKDGNVMKLLLWDTAGQERFRSGLLIIHSFFIGRALFNNSHGIGFQTYLLNLCIKIRSITRSYYRNTVAALLIYDVCNRDSFTHIPNWMHEAGKHMEPSKCVFILVGCKYDMAENNPGVREVPTEEARTFAELHGLQFLETSARTGHNVDNAFRLLTQEIYDKLKNGKFELDPDWDGIKKGYFPESTRMFRNGASRTNISRGGNQRGGSSNGGSTRYLIGEPVSQKCC
ncbi:ras-related protein Rab-39B isoform X2 [Lepeophtheirus salmonis]|uniref:ras-related protein Rab-39B isoform X2 n=1 Tax=Lepeophtheirus salmonis TaxID=72036 RepID=UPI001AE83E72|nr:ras-related protein Rab-39B-like isoform X1 [Lepeophtheirus salmonis]XP_040576086.1 ras-related protein Rab-39B-like isoform X1 [Lepeophtheirus salmonis]